MKTTLKSLLLASIFSSQILANEEVLIIENSKVGIGLGQSEVPQTKLQVRGDKALFESDIHTTLDAQIDGLLNVNGDSTFGLINSDSLIFTAGNPGDTGINMNNKKISNLPLVPTEDHEAASKKYVDDLVGVIDIDNIDIDNDNGDNALTLLKGITTGNDPGEYSTRLSIESSESGQTFLDFTNGDRTIDGFDSRFTVVKGKEYLTLVTKDPEIGLNLNLKKIVAVADPTVGHHAATKAYVDSQTASPVGFTYSDHNQYINNPNNTGSIRLNSSREIGDTGVFHSIISLTADEEGYSWLDFRNGTSEEYESRIVLTPSDNFLKIWSKDPEAGLHMNDKTIRSVRDPVNSQDAATKAYVDANSVSGIGHSFIDNTYINYNPNNLLSKFGSESSPTENVYNARMILTSDLDGKPMIDVRRGDAVGYTVRIQVPYDKDYLQVRSSDPEIGLNINNKKITELKDPTDPQDAATKAYVDSYNGNYSSNPSFESLEISTSNIDMKGNNPGIFFRNSNNDARGFLQSHQLQINEPGGGSNKIVLRVTQPSPNQYEGQFELSSSDDESVYMDMTRGNLWSEDYDVRLILPKRNGADNNSNNFLRLITKDSNVGLDIDSKKVINLKEPTNPQDAATKAYVDQRIQEVLDMLP